MIYEYDFFDSNQLKQILSLFNSGKFVDGARTGSKDKFIKDNTQQADIDLNKMANQAITKILRESPIYHLHPLNKVSPCYMLKYELGQHYASHVDYWEMWGSRTDYTAVITLNDDYEGGEHFIEIGPGKVLSGLVKQISPEAKILTMRDKNSFEEAISYLNNSRINDG